MTPKHFWKRYGFFKLAHHPVVLSLDSRKKTSPNFSEALVYLLALSFG